MYDKKFSEVVANGGLIVGIYYHKTTDGYEIMDHNGYIPTHEDIEDLIQGLRKTYGYYLPKAITNHNVRMEVKWEQSQQGDPKPTPKPRKLVGGFVYLIEADNGYYKIGKAKDVEKRLKGFLKLPFQTRLIHTIASNDYNRTERALHEKFDHLRINGEWFALSPNDIEVIKLYDKLDY